MNQLRQYFLATQCCLVLAVGACYSTTARAAGIPVMDATNLQQNLISAVEAVAQTAQQIEQYKTQLQQYENQLQNTAAPTAYVWDQANQTMHDLMRATDTLTYYKQRLGSIEAYLRNYGDEDYYKASPCFSIDGCTDAQRQALNDSQRRGSEAQKKANDAVFRGLDQQQEQITQDAQQLVRLQADAQSAEGQMQAIQHANMLASHQTNQLLQIRSLLIAQQNADATRAQVIADREAKESAASAYLRASTYRPSTERKW
jgi:P-type conjugative transfer protein TrbJ